MTESNNCLGCSLANKTLPVNVVYEDEYVCCILDHDPYNEGHTLILPKKRFLDVEEFNDKMAYAVMKTSILVSKALKELFKPDGITINQNGGIFNELSHYHMHVVPRYEGQSFESFYSEDPFKNSTDKEKLPVTRLNLKNIIDKIILREAKP